MADDVDALFPRIDDCNGILTVIGNKDALTVWRHNDILRLSSRDQPLDLRRLEVVRVGSINFDDTGVVGCCIGHIGKSIPGIQCHTLWFFANFDFFRTCFVSVRMTETLLSAGLTTHRNRLSADSEMGLEVVG